MLKITTNKDKHPSSECTDMHMQQRRSPMMPVKFPKKIVLAQFSYNANGNKRYRIAEHHAVSYHMPSMQQTEFRMDRILM